MSPGARRKPRKPGPKLRPMLNPEYTQTIKESVSAYEAARFYGLEPRRDGFVCCPVHGEKTPSCKVYQGNRGFYCYGCHKGGSVIVLVSAILGLSFMDAQKRLNADFSLNLPLDDESPNARQKAASLASDRKKRLAERERRRSELEAQVDAALTAYTEADKAVMEAEDLPPALWTERHEEAFRSIDGLWSDFTKATLELYRFDGQEGVKQ